MFNAKRGGLILIITAAALFSGNVLLAEDGGSGQSVPAGNASADVTSLLQDLNSDSEAKRIAAIDQLGHMGTKASAAESGIVEALTKQLEEGSAESQAHAAHALGRIGEPARPAAEALVALVGSKNETLRREAVRALANIRPGAKIVGPALERLLEDGSPAVRVSALHALTEFGEEAVPLLVEALKNDKMDYWAMLALAELGPQAKAAVGPLTEKLASQRPEIRREALICLGKIGPDAAPAIPVLEKLLDDERGDAVLGVAYVLGSIGPAAQKSAERLKPYAADPDQMTRLACAWALARTNPKDKILLRRAADILAESLRSRDPAVRAAAVRGLASLKAGPAIVIPAIREAIADGDKETMDAVLEALASLGEPYVPMVARVLQDKTLRPKAARILAHMGEKARAAVPALVASLRDEDPKTRQEILFALGAIDAGAAEAVPAMIESLNDEDMDVRYSAAYALGKMGAAAAAAAPALGENLDSPDKFLALASAWALAHIEPEGDATVSKAMPLLIEALGNQSEPIRIEAAQALGAMGKKALPALEPLKKMLDDEKTKEAAQKAIESIEK